VVVELVLAVGAPHVAVERLQAFHLLEGVEGHHLGIVVLGVQVGPLDVILGGRGQLGGDGRPSGGLFFGNLLGQRLVGGAQGTTPQGHGWQRHPVVRPGVHLAELDLHIDGLAPHRSALQVHQMPGPWAQRCRVHRYPGQYALKPSSEAFEIGVQPGDGGPGLGDGLQLVAQRVAGLWLGAELHSGALDDRAQHKELCVGGGVGTR
jgi:hypothetical protein